MNRPANLADARQTYRALRLATTRHTAADFDDLARSIASELADGEDITPGLWVDAAYILHSGRDYA